jgi:hypothetical protein
MAKRGAKKKSNCVSAPAEPGSAAKRTGFTKRHSIKVEPFFLRIQDEIPVREVRDFLGSGFPDSDRKRLA